MICFAFTFRSFISTYVIGRCRLVLMKLGDHSLTCYLWCTIIISIDLVPTEYNGDIFTNSSQVPMPIWNILVCNSAGDIKHDDSTLPLDIISIPEATEFLLPCSIPHIELNWSTISVKHKWAYFHAKCCYETQHAMIPWGEG